MLVDPSFPLLRLCTTGSGLSRVSQRPPLVPDLLQLLDDMCVPETADHQKSETEVREDNREQPSDYREAHHRLRFTVVSVFRRPPIRRPRIDVLKDVSREIGHDER